MIKLFCFSATYVGCTIYQLLNNCWEPKIFWSLSFFERKHDMYTPGFEMSYNCFGVALTILQEGK